MRPAREQRRSSAAARRRTCPPQGYVSCPIFQTENRGAFFAGLKAHQLSAAAVFAGIGKQYLHRMLQSCETCRHIDLTTPDGGISYSTSSEKSSPSLYRNKAPGKPPKHWCCHIWRAHSAAMPGTRERGAARCAAAFQMPARSAHGPRRWARQALCVVHST